MFSVAQVCIRALENRETEVVDSEIACASTIVSFLSAVAGAINATVVSPEVYGIPIPLSCERPIDVIEAYLRISGVEDVYLPSYRENYKGSGTPPIRLTTDQVIQLQPLDINKMSKRSMFEPQALNSSNTWRFVPTHLSSPHTNIIQTLPVLKGVLCIYSDDVVLENIPRWRFYKP